MTGRHLGEAAPARLALAALGALLLPVTCAGCGRPDVALCRRCRWALAGPAAVVGTAGGVPVLAVVPYAGVARRLLLAWKDDGRHDLAPVVRAAAVRSLRAALAPHHGGPGVGPGADAVVDAVVDAEAARNAGGRGRPRGDPVLVVPVPSSAAARRRRGEDVLAGVTHEAVRTLRAAGRPVVLACPLRQHRGVADQSGLTADARRRNLEGALTVSGGPGRADRLDLAGRRVVLVDDVVTTGATLGEGVRVLRAAGASVVAAAVVAATPLRAGSQSPLLGGAAAVSDYRSVMAGRAGPGDGRWCPAP